MVKIKENTTKKDVKMSKKNTVDKVLKKSDNNKIKKAKKTDNKLKIKTKDIVAAVKDKKVKAPKQENGTASVADISQIAAKYNIPVLKVKQALEGLIKATGNQPKRAKKLFDEQFPISIQVSCIKIPKSPPRLLRLPLTHSILPQDAEICLIVPDIKGIPNKEHDQHLERYEEILNTKGVNNIKKVMTFHELRTEYETFELKRSLVGLYDAFLVDGKISGKVVHNLGKIFYDNNKIPNPVKIQATNLKGQIENALRKTRFQVHDKGDCFTVQVAHSNMNHKDILDNIFACIQELDKQFPGGIGNVRALNLYTPGTVTIPIYVSLKNPNEVSVPIVQQKRPKGYETVTDELSTFINQKVTVKPSGEVKLSAIGNPKKGKKTMAAEIVSEGPEEEEEEDDIPNEIEDSPVQKKGKKQKNKGNKKSPAAQQQKALPNPKIKKQINGNLHQAKNKKNEVKSAELRKQEARTGPKKHQKQKQDIDIETPTIEAVEPTTKKVPKNKKRKQSESGVTTPEKKVKIDQPGKKNKKAETKTDVAFKVKSPKTKKDKDAKQQNGFGASPKQKVKIDKKKGKK